MITCKHFFDLVKSKGLSIAFSTFGSLLTTLFSMIYLCYEPSTGIALFLVLSITVSTFMAYVFFTSCTEFRIHENNIYYNTYFFSHEIDHNTITSISLLNISFSLGLSFLVIPTKKKTYFLIFNTFMISPNRWIFFSFIRQIEQNIYLAPKFRRLWE